jgi:CDP-paratose 2-epimerase
VLPCCDLAPAGEIYNIGGGPSNTLSIWREFGEILAELKGEDIAVRFDQWRPGDQLCSAM